VGFFFVCTEWRIKTKGDLDVWNWNTARIHFAVPTSAD